MAKSVYEEGSPNNSTTSLSASDDEEIKDLKVSTHVYYPKDVVPAQWSSSPRDHKPQSTFQSSPASSLPPETLIHILQHLTSPRHLYSCVLVCRLWCECAVELLWYRPNFSGMSHLVQMLQVIGSNNTSFDYARFIRRLNFSSLSKELTDSLFIRLQRCTKLDRLTLINCSELSDEAISRVVLHCKNLVAIDLTNVKNISDDTIKLLALTTPRLQALNLGGCKNITDEGVLALAASCPILRRVKLCNLRHITDKSISALSRKCPLLLEIDLDGCASVTDEAIRDLWLNLPHLRDFRLSQCSGLTDNAFPANPENNYDIYNGGQPYISVINHTDGFPPLLLPHPNMHLRVLDLTSCAQLTDDAIAGIISVAPKIRTLYLSKCSALTDAAVESICKLGKQLHYLHLGHVSSITDRSIRTLSRTCTRLRYIDLASCTRLTDLSVFELSTLSKLRRIGLVRLNNLTDQAVFALADRHATLERIHLSYCENISVLAIHFLLTKVKNITHLSLTGNPAFRKPELQQFCRSVPRDFNTNQRAVFCVYSGKGVENLRTYLANLMAHVDAQSEEMGVNDIDYDAEAEEEFAGVGGDYPAYLSNYPGISERTPRISNISEDDLADDDGNEYQIFAREEIFEDGSNIALPVPSTIMTVRGRAGRMIVNRGGTPDSRPPIVEDINLSSVATTPSPTIRQSPSRTLSDHGTSEIRSRFGQSPIVEAPSPSPQITPHASRHYLTSRTIRPSSHTSDEVSDHSAHSSRSNGVPAEGLNGAGFYRSYATNGRSAPDVISVARTGSYTPDLVYAEIGHGRGSSGGAGPGPATIQHANERFRRASLSDHYDAVYVSNSESAPTVNTNQMEELRRQPAPLVTAGLRMRSAPSQSSEMTARPDQHDVTSPIPYLSSSPTTRQLQESVHSALTGYDAVSAGAAADLAASGVEDDPTTSRGRAVRRNFKSFSDAAEHYASVLFGRTGTHSNDSLVRERAGSGSATAGSNFNNSRNAH